MCEHNNIPLLGAPPDTFVVLEVQSVLFVRDDLLHVDNALVVELSEDLDLPDGGDREALLLVVQANLLQSHHLSWRTRGRPTSRNTHTHTGLG